MNMHLMSRTAPDKDFPMIRADEQYAESEFSESNNCKAPIIYSFDMKSKNETQINITRKTKTGNCKDGIKGCMGRCVNFWRRQTPASLLLKTPAFSNTLMLQTSLYVLKAIISGKAVKSFSDMYYCLCNPGERI